MFEFVESRTIAGIADNILNNIPFSSTCSQIRVDPSAPSYLALFLSHTTHLGIIPITLQKAEPSPIVDGEPQPKYIIAGSNQRLCQHLY